MGKQKRGEPLAVQLILCRSAQVEADRNLLHLLNLFDVYRPDLQSPQPYQIEPFCVVAQVGARQVGRHTLRLFIVSMPEATRVFGPLERTEDFVEPGSRTVIFQFDSVNFGAAGAYSVELYDGDDLLAERVLHLVD